MYVVHADAWSLSYEGKNLDKLTLGVGAVKGNATDEKCRGSLEPECCGFPPVRFHSPSDRFALDVSGKLDLVHR